MLKSITFWGTLTGLGFLFGALSGSFVHTIAAEPHSEGHPPTTAQSKEFRLVEQPLGNKVVVTLGGLGLIGLELWWFLGRKPKAKTASLTDGIQEVTIAVDGGYEPSRVVVQAGQPVQLNFDRKDPSPCLEEIRLPEFRVAKTLPLNQVTPITFTPNQPGQYEFTCGMNMFRGVIEVQAAASI